MIKYKKGYKYQLWETYSTQTNILGYDITTNFITLTPDGLLTILKYYAWDGPSGPTFDTKNFMEGSLVHDALYQLMRMGLLPQSCKEYADDRLRSDCIRDGMSKFRANYVHFGVDLGAKAAANPKNEKKIFTAP
jgi:hypothetical protein